ncbi:metallopeptidase family protein [Phytoactinopolyspora alkaliphila]|uniref:Metallopeptidase family protein n=2 Tax=Phytoactinopolyspora alkaliphila TaxID=1783498 RepID=A0A6N9YQ42_9ACTN|nr:metallopeptidase family protein [Phytoactinopolyspora alkaliphila]NED97171.1 metallopeptidase family protein [Phytoactinopolyspora alkaliphila]
MVLPPLRRDRHGRGLRTPLAPPESPLSRSRAQRFDDLVLESVERLDRRWKDELAKVEFAVEDVPVLDDWPHDWVPLARAFASTGALPARIVVFRRPLETRAKGEFRLRDLVSDVIAEQVGEMLGVDPQDVDPTYGHHG